jgi:glycosyltransferase involved in cell wall biosynthesis
METSGSLLKYVLITPARNEARFIGETLASVTRQTIRPGKWIILNDGSTDDTAQIVSSYVKSFEWIELVNLPTRKERNFAGKANAFKAGQQRLSNMEYQIIGNLDADVSLDEDHFEFLLRRFAEDPKLGVAGTIFREEGYSSETHSFEGQNYVSGQCQVFRRQCFEEIGGYFPSPAGGVDWIAVTTARMQGWHTRSFREKSFFHHRSLGTADHSALGKSYAYGWKDYILGGHPFWELLRACYQMRRKPYVLGGVMLLAGFASGYLKRSPRVVSPELMHFHRREQLLKLKSIFHALLRGRRIDSFALLPDVRGDKASHSASSEVV